MNTGNQMKPSLSTSLAAIVFGLAFSGIASAGPYIFDGLVDPMEYANSAVTNWSNDHNVSGSQFQPGGGQSTTFYWEQVGTEFRLGLMAPLAAKNMIWGDFLSNATNPSPAWDEAMLYYQHWCSPNNGMAAATDGSNCDHHDDGFDRFLEKIGEADFKTMVDSEGVKMKGESFKLVNSKDGAVAITSGSYKTSLTYLIGNGICNPSSCDAVNTAMSFEFLWTSVAQGAMFKDWLLNASNELTFHLSPERGGPPTDIPEIPIPAAFWLFGTALIGFIGLSRRTNLS